VELEVFRAEVAMGQTQELKVVLSEEAAQFVQSKVSSGEFASESDVVRESLEVLRQEDEERKLWEQNVVGPAYDRYKANPGSAISADELERRLAEKRRVRAEAR
jgi:antitoxin ParD1/3/4